MTIQPVPALFAACTLVATEIAAAGPPSPAPRRSGHAPAGLSEVDVRVDRYQRNGRVMRLYGEAFSHGASPAASAETFLDRHVEQLGVERDDLRLVRAQPVMYMRKTGRYRFTLLTYAQYADDVPVFRGELRLLHRNEPGHPLTWANTASLRPAAGFRAPPVADGRGQRGRGSALRLIPALAQFEDPRLVVWAGVDDMTPAPRLAWVFTGRSADATRPGYQRRLFVTDAQTGEVIHTEDLILRDDVVGHVSGRATQGIGSELCGPVEPTPLPYARVSIGETVAFADASGDFVIPDAGSDPVIVASPVRGRWFRIFNMSGPDTVLELEVTPPGPADFLHNETDGDELRRAEVNAYLQANVVRDFALTILPDFPLIADEAAFPVNVNIDSDCNGFYDGASLNFYTSGGKCSNTAFSTFVHHEYGHHLINVAANGGQGAYGEGMSDSVAVLITDDPGWAYGYRTECNEPRRSADNDCQYVESECSTCGEDIHGCGQLLSGCIWDTRNELLLTEPDDYRDIISSLALNSILLHNGSLITPAITVDFLTLDDDDGNIFNGTPHDQEIATGFGRHGLDAPPLPIGVEFPDGLPEWISPDGEALRVVVVPVTEEPKPGSGVLYLDDGSGLVEISMDEVESNVYDAVFPASTCGTRFTYYFGAKTMGGDLQLWPFGAPESGFSVFAADDIQVVFADDFETDQGWTVVSSEDLIRGAWERGVPIGEGVLGDPRIDADGSGQCYVTDNRPGNSDVDNGSTTLISPVMDAAGAAAIVSYFRWFSNTCGVPSLNDTLEVAFSHDDGATWTVAEDLGPTGDGVDGGWFHRQLIVGDFVENTDAFRMRFTAADPIPGTLVEAGVDGIELSIVICPEPCPADLNANGEVSLDDLLRVLAGCGPGSDCPEDLDGDGEAGLGDLLLVLDNLGACPPRFP